jgi:hypothetical protein
MRKERKIMIKIEIDNLGPIGIIPEGHDLVIYEKGENPMDGLVLLGFDEIGMFDHNFNNPAYAFMELV